MAGVLGTTAREPPARWRGPLTGAAVGALAGFLARDLAVDSLASLWVPAAAAGALAWSTRLRPVVAAGTAVLAMLWLAVAFTPLSASLARGLVRRDSAAPADAVLVLASRLQADGEPTAEAASRLARAVELLRGGLAPRVILTELPPPAPSHAALARRSLRALGLDSEVVSVGPVRRTRDEALLVAALCRNRRLDRLLVVTSPTHSRRACAALEREGLEVICAPAVETRFDLETLDRPVERFDAFRAATHEWLGLWLYRGRGWMEAAPAGESSTANTTAARRRSCPPHRRRPSRSRTAGASRWG